MYISPTVITPFFNGALTPPPLFIAISASTIFLIVSVTVAPIGLTPASLLCGRSSLKSATLTSKLGDNSFSYFPNVSSISLSTGKSLIFLEISIR